MSDYGQLVARAKAIFTKDSTGEVREILEIHKGDKLVWMKGASSDTDYCPDVGGTWVSTTERGAEGDGSVWYKCLLDDKIIYYDVNNCVREDIRAVLKQDMVTALNSTYGKSLTVGTFDTNYMRNVGGSNRLRQFGFTTDPDNVEYARCPDGWSVLSDKLTLVHTYDFNGATITDTSYWDTVSDCWAMENSAYVYSIFRSVSSSAKSSVLECLIGSLNLDASFNSNNAIVLAPRLISEEIKRYKFDAATFYITETTNGTVTKTYAFDSTAYWWYDTSEPTPDMTHTLAYADNGYSAGVIGGVHRTYGGVVVLSDGATWVSGGNNIVKNGNTYTWMTNAMTWKLPGETVGTSVSYIDSSYLPEGGRKSNNYIIVPQNYSIASNNNITSTLLPGVTWTYHYTAFDAPGFIGWIYYTYPITVWLNNADGTAAYSYGASTGSIGDDANSPYGGSNNPYTIKGSRTVTVPARSGYTFLGYYIDDKMIVNASGSVVDIIPGNWTTNVVTLLARWQGSS